MTIIVWDGKTLAADRRSVNNGHASTVCKIQRGPAGELLSYSGDYDVGVALAEWYCAGADPTKFPKNRDTNVYCHSYLMVIHPDGKIVRYEREPVALRFLDSFAVMGSGRDYALAALHLGCDAVKAVEVACALDINCGNGIDTLTLEPRHATE